MASLASAASSKLPPEWYQTHRAPLSSPSWTTFLTGLAASPSTSTESITKLFRTHCLANGLWDQPDVLTHDENLPAFYTATNAISLALRDNYPAAPKLWIETWVRAIVLDSSPRQGLVSQAGDNVDDEPSSKGYEGFWHYQPSSEEGERDISFLATKGKGKGKERVSKFTELFDYEPESFPWEKKGEEQEVTYDEAEWFASRRKGKGKEKGKGPEYLQPQTHAPPPPSTSKGKGRETRSKAPLARPSRTSKTGDRTSIAVANKIEPQIEYVIEKAVHWSVSAEDGRKKAEQRVKDKIRKDREKKKQAQLEEQLRRSARFGLPGKQAAPVLTSPDKSTSSSINRQRTIRPLEGNQPRMNQPSRTHQPASKPSTSSAPASTSTAQPYQSTASAFSTSSDTLPYTMTDKERREKTMRVRRQFPSSAMPRLVEAEKSLIETRGIVDDAVILLGGAPKRSYAATPPPPIPRKSPLRRAGAILGTRKSAENVKKTSGGSQAREGNTQQKGMVTPKRKPGLEAAASLLTPPTSDRKSRLPTKLSLHRRIQNAAHSAGKHISFSSSGSNNDSRTPSPKRNSSGSRGSASVPLPAPASPLSPGIRAVLGALKKNRQSQPQPLSPGAIEDKYYEFFVTKERAYKSGGEEEDAVNPLEGYRNVESDVESESECEEEQRGRKRERKEMSVAAL